MVLKSICILSIISGLSLKRKNINNDQIELEQNENGKPWETHGLFSDYYLLNKLPETIYWPKDSDIDLAFIKCREIFDKNKYRLGKYGHEDDAKRELIEPVFEILGFLNTTEATMPGKGRKSPDYLLFADEASKEAALGLALKNRYSHAITIAEAKRYGVNLGDVADKDSAAKFPHQQIREYLSEAVDSSLRKPFFNWAILTNGSDWRLYYRYAQSYSFFNFNLEYGVNIKKYFKYFWILFNAASFRKDSNDICQLDRILDQSIQHSTALEDDLRRRVYRLLERLAQGFYKRELNRISASQLDELYETCLFYMYRLLFVLYAEGWDLLPVTQYRTGTNHEYRENYSLERLKSTIKKIKPEDDVKWRLYNELDELFTLIDGNNDALNKVLGVPRYNGGLFDPDRTPSLKKWKVGNNTLGEVLKGLMFDFRHSKPGETEEFENDETIDYSELNVRQLGSIYEGLLDHHLELNKNNGEIELIEDNHSTDEQNKTELSKRKITGSYYTPDFIVQYILNQTVKPILQQANDYPVVKMALEAGRKDNSFADEVLKLKILDPAMGSGHFLVKATELLADEIASHPTTQLAVKYPPANIPHDFEEIAYWRRKVVENCIYGVDINPLAVELAKLSLWLTCISSERPLSFIDHHVQCGNALIGTKLSDLDHLKRAGEDTDTLLVVKGLDEARKQAVSQLEYLRTIESIQFESVHEKKDIWEKQVLQRIAAFKSLANLRSAYDLGFNLENKEYSQYAREVLENAQSLPQSAYNISREYNVLHWELAFPEVFPANGDNGGFDVVVGNPPYVRSGVIGDTKNYLSGYFESYHGNADLSVYFIERGINLLRPGGRFGFIVPNKWMRADYGVPLQNFIRRFQIETLADFGELKVFKSSSTFPLVMIVSKDKPSKQPKYIALKELIRDPEHLNKVIEKEAFDLEDEAFRPGGFTLVRKEISHILNKMQEAGKPLGQVVEGKMYRGILTGFNKAFIIDSVKREELIRKDPKSEEIIVPFVIGDDVRKWRVNYRNRYLIFTRRGIDITEYPAIEEHLAFWKNNLTPKESRNKGIDGRKPGDYKWYEIQDTISYYEEFTKPKIIWPEIAKESRFAFDSKCFYTNKTTFILPTEDIYLLGILNSSCIWEFLKRTCTVLGDPDKRGRLMQQEMYVEKIPIPLIKSKLQGELSDLVSQNLKLKDRLAVSAGLAESRRIESQINDEEREIDKIVYHLYGLTEAEIKVIEGNIN